MMMNNQQNKSIIWTNSGIGFNPLNPNAEDININDIAHALSHICRFTGHCNYFYSVAMHGIIGTQYFLESSHNHYDALCFLLHDAAEAYICDLTKPVKNCIPIYNDIENKLSKAINEKLIPPISGIEYNHKLIKEVDEIILLFEMDHLFYKRLNSELLAEAERLNSSVYSYFEDNFYYWYVDVRRKDFENVRKTFIEIYKKLLAEVFDLYPNSKDCFNQFLINVTI